MYDRASWPNCTSNGDNAIRRPAIAPLRGPAARSPMAQTSHAQTAPNMAEGSRNSHCEVPIWATSHNNRK